MVAALQGTGFDVDYVERRGGRVLGAVRVGKVRLIDNVEA
jgi:pantothenate synthetase